MIAYPNQAQELIKLLQEDQAEKKELGRLYFQAADKNYLGEKRRASRLHTRRRARRMLHILDEIGEPSISNIGADGAQAVSILALHDSTDTLRRVLMAFVALYERDRGETYYQAIPSMTDFLLILERKPQRFGTQWLFDKEKEPFLPIVEDFEHVNQRRAIYGIEPLHWPKSLAIPESEQPWLNRPLSELVMRKPTDNEYAEF